MKLRNRKLKLNVFWQRWSSIELAPKGSGKSLALKYYIGQNTGGHTMRTTSIVTATQSNWPSHYCRSGVERKSLPPLLVKWH